MSLNQLAHPLGNILGVLPFFEDIDVPIDNF